MFSLNSKYPCAFVDWDNTPRRKTEATIFRGFTPEKFEYYFDKLYSKALEKDSEFLLINAWNEWAEGTYLEPDTDNEYKILNSVKKVKQKYETPCE